MHDRPVAVFDSGLGGLSVLRRLIQTLPEENFLYFGDSANAPYGPRPTQDIRALTERHAARLFDEGAKALVVACNTATSAAIDALRQRYPERIIIGIEPALKPAIDRHPGGRIVVMATQATLREQKFATLMERCGEHSTILKCPCPALVEFVERGELDSPALRQMLHQTLAPQLAQTPDAVVLGCTHFPFASRAIRAIVGPQPELLDGAEGTARETRRRLAAAGLLRSGGPGSVTIQNSLPGDAILRRCEALLRTLP